MMVLMTIVMIVMMAIDTNINSWSLHIENHEILPMKTQTDITWHAN